MMERKRELLYSSFIIMNKQFIKPLFLIFMNEMINFHKTLKKKFKNLTCLGHCKNTILQLDLCISF